MKLIINYDLVNEIMKAKTGINLQTLKWKFGLYLGTIGTVELSTFILNPNADHLMLIKGLYYAVFIYGGQEIVLRKFTKKNAESNLKKLSSSLKTINIYTDEDSIKKARHYKTQYKIVRNDKLTLQQNKYIMLPTDGTLNADEVSLLQEHTIGSKEYVLSIGEPQKSYSQVTSKNFARF